MRTKVRNYTDNQLLERVKRLPSFKGIPSDYWILGVRSNEDTPDVYDDKFYVFKGETHVYTMSGTTNPGVWSLKNFLSYGARGSGVIKANEWYYSVWAYGKHRGKVSALRQVGGFKVIRDNNRNKKSGDVRSHSLEYNKGFNFHPNSYKYSNGIRSWFIGKWSLGCQVVNNLSIYYKFMAKVKYQKRVTYCLIDEF